MLQSIKLRGTGEPCFTIGGGAYRILRLEDGFKLPRQHSMPSRQSISKYLSCLWYCHMESSQRVFLDQWYSMLRFGESIPRGMYCIPLEKRPLELQRIYVPRSSCNPAEVARYINLELFQRASEFKLTRQLIDSNRYRVVVLTDGSERCEELARHAKTKVKKTNLVEFHEAPREATLESYLRQRKLELCGMTQL